VESESAKAFVFEVPANGQEYRLDSFLATCSSGLSRSLLKSLIKSGHVKVNGRVLKPSQKVKSGDRIVLSVPPPAPPRLKPEPMALDIVHEDASLLVLNKPAGLVVHPAPGHATGTLVHGLLHHCKDLSQIGGITRPGILHRLDKDTSGLMVVAKNDQAHGFLSDQFRAGSIKKQYLAIVHGCLSGGEGKIDLPISRHPKKRKEMAVRLSGGRDALTYWRTQKLFKTGFSLLSVKIKTGRTHQIRVHLSYLGHPVVGDPLYGHGSSWWKKHPLYKKGMLAWIKRQMLHAYQLGFIHPDHERFVAFRAPLPEDMIQVLKRLNGEDVDDLTP
jgi:23S rRNA pseudouridine1911/1915/1917 synthase